VNNDNDLDHVRSATAPEINQRIDRTIEEHIRYYARKSDDEISERLQDLDREWDIERWLEMNASGIAFVSVFLGLTVSKKWLLLSGTVLSLLFYHAVKGWCPPVPVLRKFGVRTRKEIDEEKFALKALRGDFRRVPEKREDQVDRPMIALNAVRFA
jgi:hypothetical protein